MFKRFRATHNFWQSETKVINHRTTSTWMKKASFRLRNCGPIMYVCMHLKWDVSQLVSRDFSQYIEHSRNTFEAILEILMKWDRMYNFGLLLVWVGGQLTLVVGLSIVATYSLWFWSSFLLLWVFILCTCDISPQAEASVTVTGGRVIPYQSKHYFVTLLQLSWLNNTCKYWPRWSPQSIWLYLPRCSTTGNEGKLKNRILTRWNFEFSLCW